MSSCTSQIAVLHLFPLVQLEILVVFCFSVNLQALRTEYQDEFALSTSPSLSSETRRFWLDLFAVVFWSECLANPEKSKLNKCPFMVRIVLLDEKKFHTLL